MTIKKWNGSAWVAEYPLVDVDSIVATGTPSSSTFLRGDGAWGTPSGTGAHSHGNIGSGGHITASATIASGDHFVIADNSSSNALTTSSITFGTSTSTFLRNDGTWASAGGGGTEYEWEYVARVTGSTTLTYSSMSTATYEYKFVVEVQTTGEDTSNPYIRINNESNNEYSYQYQSVTQTAETTETVLNAGDALTSLIYTGADLSSYSNGGTSGSTVHRAEFIYSVSPYSTSPGAYTATIRGWAHTHWVSQSGTSYDGMVQSTFIGTRDNLFFSEFERLDYTHAINNGSTDYHEMRVYRRERK